MFPQAFQNYILILLMLVLGVLPIFNSGYNHPVVYLAGLVLAAGAGIAIAIARWQEPLAPLGPSSHGWSKVPGFGWLMLFVGWTALGLGWSIDRYETLLALYELFLGVRVQFLPVKGTLGPGQGRFQQGEVPEAGYTACPGNGF